MIEVAGPLQHPGQCPGGRRLAHLREQPVEQREEALHPGCHAAQPSRLGGSREPLEEGHALLRRMLHRLLDRGAPDAARRRVDDAAQRHVVGRVHHQPQVGERVLHLGAVVEAHAAHHHVGHVVLEQLLLEGPRLGVGAVEDRALAEGPALAAHRVEDAAHHVLGLVALVPGLVEPDRVAPAALGDEALLLARLVVGDHARGAVEDGPRRAVVALEPHDARLGIVLLEVEDVADVGAAPGVDRLVRVAHHAQVAVLAGELVHQLVLHAVGVLVLVHQHVLPAAAVVLEHLGEALEELHGLQQQVAEVEGVRVGEQALVGGVELGGLLGLEVLRALGRLGGQAAVVLPLVDAPAQAARLVDLRVEAVAALRLLDDRQGVRLVVDHEAPGEAQVAGIAAQDPDARGVEGAHPEGVDLRTEELAHALPHLARRLVGEGDSSCSGGMPQTPIR